MKHLASYWIMGLSAAMAACAAQAEMEPPASLDQAYAAAHAVSGQPLALERDQAAWREALPATDNADQVADRIAALAALARSGEKIARARPAIAGLSAACVTDWLDGCRTDAGGYVNPDGARRLYWQRQIGSTVEDGVSAGLILMVEDAAQTLRPVAWTFDGVTFDPPQVITAHDQTYVGVPGFMAGSGSFNADVVFRWDADPARPLIQIDNWSWRDDLDARLPKGLEVWKGVRFNYPTLTAETALWRPEDANCCPSGGLALLSFDIQDNRLALTDVAVQPAGEP